MMINIEQKAFIGIGSNLGNRLENIQQALQLLHARPKIKVKNISHFYETEPLTLNGEKQNFYLNGVIQITTTLNPVKLLSELQDIENSLGRQRDHKWAARTLDLDILLFENEIIRGATLTVPHPEMHRRRFVLEPLAEIAPDFIHPIKGIKIQTLLQKLRDNKKVSLLYKFQLSFASDPMVKKEV